MSVPVLASNAHSRMGKWTDNYYWLVKDVEDVKPDGKGRLVYGEGQLLLDGEGHPIPEI